jgi:hypothetical protein
MSAREDHVHTLIKEYIRPMIEENFTEEEHQNQFGDFEVSVTSIDEQLKLSQTFKNGIEDGYLFPTDINDLNHMRKAIDFEKMDDLIKAMEAQANKMQENMKGDRMTNRDVNDKTATPYSHNIS